ncbi:tetratricopeptide repeat protein [bacterium]|nr:tetratricopeptide repeat protein [bacterium]
MIPNHALKKIPVLLFAAGISFRLLLLWQAAHSPLMYGLVQDADNYHETALKILSGHINLHELKILNPLYPFFLAFWYRIFGPNPFLILMVQTVIEWFSLFLIFRLGELLWNRSAGIAASLIYCFYNTAMLYSCMGIAPALIVHLILGCLLCLALALHTGRSGLWIASGACLGIAFFGRPNILLVVPLVGLWIMTTKYRERIKKILLWISGMAVPVILVMILNFTVSRNAAFLPSSGGILFYMGNNEHASGYFDPPPGSSTSPVDVVNSSIRMASQETQKQLSPGEASRYWFKKGLHYCIHHPGQALLLYIRKGILFWRAREIPLNVNIGLCKTFLPVLRWPLLVSFGMILPLGLTGMFLALRNPGSGYMRTGFLHMVVIAVMLGVLPFFVAARFRFPAVPVLILFAALTLVRIRISVSRREWKSLAVLAACMGILMFLSRVPVPFLEEKNDRALDFSNLGAAYMRMGRMDEAGRALKEAVAADSNHSYANYNMGILSQKMQLREQAVRYYRKCLEQSPGYMPALFNLSLLYKEMNKTDEAISGFQTIVLHQPDNRAAWRQLTELALNKEDAVQAGRILEQARQHDPSSPFVFFQSGILAYRNHHYKEAATYWRRALELDPDNAEIRSHLDLVTKNTGP